MISPPELVDIAREGFVLALLVTLPLLGAALVAGIVSAALQSFTRVSEPMLTIVPRLLAVAMAVIIAAPWIGARVSGFAERVWVAIQTVH
jgi:type III secretion protein S